MEPLHILHLKFYVIKAITATRRIFGVQGWSCSLCFMGQSHSRPKTWMTSTDSSWSKNTSSRTISQKKLGLWLRGFLTETLWRDSQPPRSWPIPGWGTYLLRWSCLTTKRWSWLERNSRSRMLTGITETTDYKRIRLGHEIQSWTLKHLLKDLLMTQKEKIWETFQQSLSFWLLLTQPVHIYHHFTPQSKN